MSPALGKSLEGLVALCREKRALEKKWVGSVPIEQKRKQVEALRYRGASAEDLCLDFTLPGKPEWDLKVSSYILLFFIFVPLSPLPLSLINYIG